MQSPPARSRGLGSNAQPTRDIYALAAAVRDGELSPEQREQLVRLLHRIESAYGLAPLAAQRYPDAPERQNAYATAVWEPVAAECARLLQQWNSKPLACSGPGHPREDGACHGHRGWPGRIMSLSGRLLCIRHGTPERETVSAMDYGHADDIARQPQNAANDAAPPWYIRPRRARRSPRETSARCTACCTGMGSASRR
jgi:hypothetical protein